jgi:hypothetical protein
MEGPKYDISSGPFLLTGSHVKANIIFLSDATTSVCNLKGCAARQSHKCTISRCDQYFGWVWPCHAYVCQQPTR